MLSKLNCCLLLTCLLSGCSQHRSNLTECETARQGLETRIEELAQQNERLLIEKRSDQHRVAEAEKALARALGGSEFAEYERPVAEQVQTSAPSATDVVPAPGWRPK